jgi:hypothetical protein
MSLDFDREEVKNWERIDENYVIDRKTFLGKGSFG